MERGLKLFHFFGLTIFLGSIITFIIVSALVENASLENIAFGRKIISSVTSVLTLPGIWIIAVTGIWMGYKRYGIQHRLFQVKLLFIMLILINAYFFIVPAVASATELAVNSLSLGRLLPEYKTEYMKESIFGGINVLLAVAAAIVGIWKIGVKTSSST